MVTMLLGGLWHGASWNFVLWGAWWGAWLCAAHLWRQAPAALRRMIPGGVAWAGTLAIAYIGWVPFRCQGLDRTTAMFGRIFSRETAASLARLRFFDVSQFATSRSAMLLALFAIACVVAMQVLAVSARLDAHDPWKRPAAILRGVRGWLASERPTLRAAAVAAFVFVTLMLRRADSESFIYFQF